MLYTTPTPNLDYIPGQPLAPAQPLFRTREEAHRAAPGRPTLAVAVRFDATRGSVHAMPPAALALPGGRGWSAPAIVDDRGGVIAFAAIPAALVRLVGPASIRVHAGRHEAGRGPMMALIPAREVSGRQRNRSALTPK